MSLALNTAAQWIIGLSIYVVAFAVMAYLYRKAGL